MANSAVRAIVRIKGIPMRAIIDTGANIFIITLPVVKKLHMIIGMLNKSKIIAVDQIKKNVIRIVRDAPFSIQDVRVPVNLLVINILEDNLFLEMDWMDRYKVDLSFHKKELRFQCKKQDFITSNKKN